MEELVYTSAPQGLLPGTTGFCTVEMTEGTPVEIMESLESLSAYDKDPSGTVNWMHVRLQTIREARHVVSRIGPLQGEFSGRSNKLAHHLCLSADELPPQGPMQIIGRGGPLLHQWSGQVRKLPPQQSLHCERAASLPRACQTWAAAVGDAGAAGAVLSKLRSLGSNPLWVVRTPAMDALAMTDEMLALLPGPQRWDVTFCTYLHTLPRSAQCQLRWVLPDSPAMQQLRDLGPDQLIDLRSGAAAILAGADPSLVEAARQGTAVSGGIAGSPMRQSSAATTLSISRVAAVNRSASGEESFDIADPAARQIPPPPPKTQSSPLRWALIGTAIGIIPACALIVFVLRYDPDLAAMREVNIPGPPDPPPAKPVLEPSPAAPPEPEDKESPPTKSANKPKANDTKPANREPTKATRPPKPKSEIPQTLPPIPLRLTSFKLDMSPDKQTLFQGPGIYALELRTVAPVVGAVEFQLTEPDPSGFSDLNKVTPSTRQQEKMGTIYLETDRVSFSWFPDVSTADASAFILAHEFLIKNDTHLTTVPLEFALPAPVPSPLMRGDAEIMIPAWLPLEIECLVQPTFFSNRAVEGIEMEKFVIASPGTSTAAVTNESDWHKIEHDLTPLMVPGMKAGITAIEAEMKGSETNPWADISTSLEFRDHRDVVYPWASYIRVIKEEVIKQNESRKKKDPNGTPINYKACEKVIDDWRDSLRCELRLYARVNGRDILWGQSGGFTQ